MKEATALTKEKIIDIITAAYLDNETLNETVIQDKKRKERLRGLVTYSYFLCSAYGKVYLSEDGLSAAMILFPDTRKFSLRMLLRDLHLLFFVTGFRNALKALSREKALSKVQGNAFIYHLYFIGTSPEHKGKGSGSALIKELIADSEKLNRPAFVEARVPSTSQWYQKFGFTVYHELVHSDRLWYCLRREI